MLSFHGDESIKTALLQKLQGHYDADEIVKGVYWQDGKGCAVGCAIECGDHSLYEKRFGIPHSLAHLEDRIFEGLPNAIAKEWPIRFISAIPVGVDLSLVEWQLKHWILTDKTVNPGIDHDLVRDAVAGVAALCLRKSKGEEVSEEEWRAAEHAAWSAAWSARSAARSAWSAARSAARSAEHAAWSAAESAEHAARSAAESSEHAAWSAAWSAAESAAYMRIADKLVELLERCGDQS